MNDDRTEANDNAIREARELLESVERNRAIVLYVAPGEDPTAALKRLRAYFCGLMDFDTRRSLALGVACLDRVLDTLEGFEARVVFERRRP